MVSTSRIVWLLCVLMGASLIAVGSAQAIQLTGVQQTIYGWNDNPGDSIGPNQTGSTTVNRANISSDGGSFLNPTSLAVAYSCLNPGQPDTKSIPPGSTVCPTTNTGYLQSGDLVFIPNLGWFRVEDQCGACAPGGINEGAVDVWTATASATGSQPNVVKGVRDIQVFHPSEIPNIPASLKAMKANPGIWQSLVWTDEDHMKKAKPVPIYKKKVFVGYSYLNTLYVDLNLTPVSVQVSPPPLVTVLDGAAVTFTGVSQGASGTALKKQLSLVWSRDNPLATIAPIGKSQLAATATLNTSNPGAGTCATITATAGTRNGESRVALPGVTGCSKLTVSQTGAGFGKVISAPQGINCGATCTASYGIGPSTPGICDAGLNAGHACNSNGDCPTSICAAPVSLTVTDSSTSTFNGWSGDCSGSNPTQILVTGENTCKFDELLTAPVSFVPHACVAGGAQYAFDVSGPVGAFFGYSECTTTFNCGGWSPGSEPTGPPSNGTCPGCVRDSINEPITTTITLAPTFVGSAFFAFDQGDALCLPSDISPQCFVTMSLPNPCP
jgi:hypothetical protein